MAAFISLLQKTVQKHEGEEQGDEGGGVENFVAGRSNFAEQLATRIPPLVSSSLIISAPKPHMLWDGDKEIAIGFKGLRDAAQGGFIVGNMLKDIETTDSIE